MGIGVSVFLMAVGAILTFGITADASGSGFNIDTIGWILMGAGLLGLLITSMFFASWAPFARGSEVREREVVDDRDRTHTH